MQQQQQQSAHPPSLSANRSIRKCASKVAVLHGSPAGQPLIAWAPLCCRHAWMDSRPPRLLANPPLSHTFRYSRFRPPAGSLWIHFRISLNAHGKTQQCCRSEHPHRLSRKSHHKHQHFIELSRTRPSVGAFSPLHLASSRNSPIFPRWLSNAFLTKDLCKSTRVWHGSCSNNLPARATLST